MLDTVEIVERVQTGFINGRHRTWIEVVVGTEASGEIAVFTPTHDELQRGEGELAVEHLRREATALADEIVRVRNAFRTARDMREVPSFWAPLIEHVEVEGDLRVPSMSAERIALITIAGVLVGMAGYQFSESSAWTALLSAALILYALVGAIALSYVDRDHALGAGLRVPVRLGAPGAVPARSDVRFHGPYVVVPQVGIIQRGDRLQVVPYVEIVDGNGRTVRLLTPAEQSDEYDAEAAAALLLREADMFVEEIEHSEISARRLAGGE